ncbi:hypothetical protein SSX86_007251 [Deinandra increscens subsp. villosa]|uniref:GOLD domain-containing protein n=1 Tax=Deinandra increscens subsp. villosa TaxID=3103831 RepID=A0AAP0H4J9_9ASTR
MTMVILGLASVKGMRFDLETGATKCITEDIKINAMTVGKYSIVKPVEGFPLSEEDRITVRVTSPLGNNYHYADRKDSGSFAFTAGEAGDYMACFWAAKQTPDKSLSIDFEWKSGLAAKDWSKVAKKGQVEMMELELKKLYDSVTMVHEEMFNLRASHIRIMTAYSKSNSGPNNAHLFPKLYNLVMVAGHSGYTSSSCERIDKEDSWFLQSYQKNPRQASTFVAHIEDGIESAIA